MALDPLSCMMKWAQSYQSASKEASNAKEFVPKFFSLKSSGDASFPLREKKWTWIFSVNGWKNFFLNIKIFFTSIFSNPRCKAVEEYLSVGKKLEETQSKTSEVVSENVGAVFKDVSMLHRFLIAQVGELHSIKKMSDVEKKAKVTQLNRIRDVIYQKLVGLIQEKYKQKMSEELKGKTWGIDDQGSWEFGDSRGVKESFVALQKRIQDQILEENEAGTDSEVCELVQKELHATRIPLSPDLMDKLSTSVTEERVKAWWNSKAPENNGVFGRVCALLAPFERTEEPYSKFIAQVESWCEQQEASEIERGSYGEVTIEKTGVGFDICVEVHQQGTLAFLKNLFAPRDLQKMAGISSARFVRLSAFADTFAEKRMGKCQPGVSQSQVVLCSIKKNIMKNFFRKKKGFSKCILDGLKHCVSEDMGKHDVSMRDMTPSQKADQLKALDTTFQNESIEVLTFMAQNQEFFGEEDINDVTAAIQKSYSDTRARCLEAAGAEAKHADLLAAIEKMTDTVLEIQKGVDTVDLLDEERANGMIHYIEQLKVSGKALHDAPRQFSPVKDQASVFIATCERAIKNIKGKVEKGKPYSKTSGSGTKNVSVGRDVIVNAQGAQGQVNINVAVVADTVSNVNQQQAAAARANEVAQRELGSVSAFVRTLVGSAISSAVCGFCIGGLPGAVSAAVKTAVVAPMIRQAVDSTGMPPPISALLARLATVALSAKTAQYVACYLKKAEVIAPQPAAASRPQEAKPDSSSLQRPEELSSSLSPVVEPHPVSQQPLDIPQVEPTIMPPFQGTGAFPSRPLSPVLEQGAPSGALPYIANMIKKFAVNHLLPQGVKWVGGVVSLASYVSPVIAPFVLNDTPMVVGGIQGLAKLLQPKSLVDVLEEQVFSKSA